MDIPKPGPTGVDCEVCGKPTTWYGWTPGVECRPCGKIWQFVFDAETMRPKRLVEYKPIVLNFDWNK
jgi:hypothetical protein